MEPVSALMIALAAAYAITRGAADAAVSQARQEARAAAEAIREDLAGRREAWAKALAERVAGGRAGGPATGMWWAWAAVRTGRALRDGLRREPREGERAQAIRGETGPWRRIYDAGVNGARFAREQARQHRRHADQRGSTNDRAARVRLAVCEQCGAVVAAGSLQTATVGPARRTLRVCVACVNKETAKTTGPTAAPQTEKQGDTVDADIVPDQPKRRPEVEGGRPQLNAPKDAAKPPQPAPLPSPKPTPKPAAPKAPAPKARPTKPVPAADAAPTPKIEQGEPMAPRSPGQLVPRHGSRVATHAARGNGGESYTHGQWNRVVVDIEKRLDALPAVLEMMLHRLSAADAGRSQVVGVVALHDEIALYVKQVREMLAIVNRMERPVLTAVEAAGGPDEIASISYLREV